MNLMTEVKQKLNKPNFRQSSLKKLFIVVFKWLQVDEKTAVKLTDKLYDVICKILDAQRYSNDEISTMFRAYEINHKNPIVYKDLKTTIVNSTNFQQENYTLKISYIPNKVALSYDDLEDLVSFLGKRFQTVDEYIASLNIILTKILTTINIAIEFQGKTNIYSSNGLFSTSAELWNTFLNSK